MTFDELAELMSEAPGGDNHGRKRSQEGGWVSLETYGYDIGDLPYVIDDPEYRATSTYKHGTLARYTHGQCRCSLCREAKRDYERVRRSR